MTNIPVWWRQQRKRTDDYGLIKDIPGSIITLLEKHFSLLIISVPWDEPRVVPASESLPTSLSFHRLSEVWFSAHWRLFLSAGDTIDKWDLCRLRIETSLSRQSQNQSSSWRTRRATQLNGWTEITSLFGTFLYAHIKCCEQFGLREMWTQRFGINRVMTASSGRAARGVALNHRSRVFFQLNSQNRNHLWPASGPRLSHGEYS